MNTTIPLTVDEVLGIIDSAREQVEAGSAHAALADAYAIVAADRVAFGDIVRAHELTGRAAALHPAYVALHERMGDAEFGSRVDRHMDDETLQRVLDARILAISEWAASSWQATAGGVS